MNEGICHKLSCSLEIFGHTHNSLAEPPVPGPLCAWTMKEDISQAPLLSHLSLSVLSGEGEEELVSSLNPWLLCLSDSLLPPAAFSLGLLPSPE